MNKILYNDLRLKLSGIFLASKQKGYNSKEFLHKFLESEEFEQMRKFGSHKYWELGNTYVVDDFADNYKINKDKNFLTDYDLNVLGSTIFELAVRYNKNPKQISNKLDVILKYSDDIDYHSPSEIIKKCQLT